MVSIPGGVFLMGAGPMRPEEGPPRRVVVRPFWIDRTDVTNAAFAAFVAATGYVTDAEKQGSGIVFVGAASQADGPSSWWRIVPGADWRHPTGPGSSLSGKGALPVVQVSWKDAKAYAVWLGRDLPTEAQWEYAARGGRAAGRYVWGDAPFDPSHPQANVWQGVFPAIDTGEDGYRKQPSPVGCFPANGFGLYDMAGDVWQWTSDVYAPLASPVASPDGGTSGEPGDPGQRTHVIKGGSFLCSPDYCFRYRPAARQPGPSDSGENHIGFRTALRAARQGPAAFRGKT